LEGLEYFIKLFIYTFIYIIWGLSFSIISFTLVIAGLMTVLDAGLTATSREFAEKTIRMGKNKGFRTLELLIL
jgi:hypothetical protein